MPRIRFEMLFAVLALASPLAPASPAAAQPPTLFLAFGDSVTEATDFDEACECEVHECRQLCGYPWRLEAGLNAAGMAAVVVNEGFGGERTNTGVTRLDEVLDAAEVSFDVLLLMEGTNDVSRGISPEATLRNLTEMGRKASRRGIETVHATLIPRSPQAEIDPENAANADMAGRIRDLVFATDRRTVDPFEIFGSQPDVFATLYAERPMDPVGHPNAAGFSLLAVAFFNVLTDGADTVAPVVGHVEPVPGTEGVAPFAPLRVRLYDFGVGLERGASRLRVNGETVAVERSGGLTWQNLVHLPESPLPGEVTVEVSSRDLLGNAMDREISHFFVDTGVLTPCESGETTLCIDRATGDRRFRVTLQWHTEVNGPREEGDALAIPLAPIGLRRGGLFSFFNRDNPEVLVKVLDGCAINGHFWVFVAPTTTLGYELRVVDTEAALRGAPPSQHQLVVTNPDGRDAPPVSDTSAFPTCDL